MMGDKREGSNDGSQNMFLGSKIANYPKIIPVPLLNWSTVNSRFHCYFFMIALCVVCVKFCVTPYMNCMDEMVQMKYHNINF